MVPLSVSSNTQFTERCIKKSPRNAWSKQSRMIRQPTRCSVFIAFPHPSMVKSLYMPSTFPTICWVWLLCNGPATPSLPALQWSVCSRTQPPLITSPARPTIPQQKHSRFPSPRVSVPVWVVCLVRFWICGVANLSGITSELSTTRGAVSTPAW